MENIVSLRNRWNMWKTSFMFVLRATEQDRIRIFLPAGDSYRRLQVLLKKSATAVAVNQERGALDSVLLGNDERSKHTT